MFAVISHKGIQYRVMPGKDYKFDLLDEESLKKKDIVFTNVLLFNNEGKTTVGTPYISGAEVLGEVQKTILDPKVSILKFESKKRYKRTKGHRQSYSIVKILKINLPVSAKPSLDGKNDK